VILAPRQSAYIQDAIALLAGLALPFAFAPFQWFPIAVISPALLFLTWRNNPPWRAFWRGWLYGMGMFGVGVYWLHISIYQFGGLKLPVALLLTYLLVAYLACYPAVAGYVARRFFSVGEALWLLAVVPATWTLVEWLRGWILTGFPWLNLGYSQIDAPLASLAPLVGVYGVSWAVALSAGLLAYAFCGGLRQCAYPLSAIVLLWAGAFLLGRVSWTEPTGETVKVALLQGNVTQQMKWLPEERQQTIRLYQALTKKFWGEDLIIWPEAAIPAFYHSVTPVIESLQSKARLDGTDLLIGIPVLDPDGARYYNSVVAIGGHAGAYHKQHLVPFGEFMPLGKWLQRLADLLAIPMSGFSAGPANQPLLRVAGHHVGVSICYEIIFGEEIIRALPDADFLVNVSNDGWFGDSLGPHQHFQMARMRALETGRYVLRATNTGITAVIDAKGEVLARSPQFKIHTLVADIRIYDGWTLYARMGNTPVIVAFFLMLGLAAWLGRHSSAR